MGGGDAPVAKTRGEDIRLSMAENERMRGEEDERSGAVNSKPNPSSKNVQHKP